MESSIAPKKHVTFSPEIDLKQIEQPEGVYEKFETVHFVEFFPEDIKSSMKRLFVREYVYSDLVTQINQYLAANPDLKVKSIETCLYSPEDDFGKIVGRVRRSSGKKSPESTGNCRQLFGLRVWLIKLDTQNHNSPVPRIKVYHYVPKLRITGFSHASFFVQNEQTRLTPVANLQSTLQELEFESLDDVLEKINEDISSTGEKYGDILNIETVAMPLKANQYTVDLEDLEWPCGGVRGALTILRVYVYEHLASSQEASTNGDAAQTPRLKIELYDFLPKMNTWDSPLAIPDLEPFTSVLKRASQYLRSRTHDTFRVINCNTITCPAGDLTTPQKANEDVLVDTKRTFYHGKFDGYCVRSFRVIIATNVAVSPSDTSNSTVANSNGLHSTQVQKNEEDEEEVKVAKFEHDSLEEDDSSPSAVSEYHLNCKIFVPQGEFSNIDGLQSIINKWFKNREIQLISAETEIVASPLVWTSSTSLVDSSLTLNSTTAASISHRSMFFKFYINGSIKESN